MYWSSIGSQVGIYVYPPPLQQAVQALPSTTYVAVWTGVCFASFGYVFGRWSFVLAPLALVEVATGEKAWWAGPIHSVLLLNVTMPMVAAMIAGLRHPAWWAVPILTKITSGIGVLWFAFRGEWRAFGIALLATVAIATVSLVLAPAAWDDFARMAIGRAGETDVGIPIVGPPLVLRLPAAVALLWWGARRDNKRVVPVASALALAGMYGWVTFTSVAFAALSPRLRDDDATG